VLCLKSTLNGPLRFRAAPRPCASSEIELGTFDGTTLQLSGINLQIASGAGKTDAMNGKRTR
jgi:hypothetical protein